MDDVNQNGSCAGNLQRHRSALDTRTEDSSHNECVVNHLGSQLAGNPANNGVNNSQSTPNLTHTEIQSTEQTVQQTHVDNTPAVTDSPINKLVSDKTNYNVEKTEKIISPVKSSLTRSHESHHSSDASDETDGEQNAEATEQPRIGSAVMPTSGSVNTLSSSPFQSSEDEERQEPETKITQSPIMEESSLSSYTSNHVSEKEKSIQSVGKQVDSRKPQILHRTGTEQQADISRTQLSDTISNKPIRPDKIEEIAAIDGVSSGEKMSGRGTANPLANESVEFIDAPDHSDSTAVVHPPSQFVSSSTRNSRPVNDQKLYFPFAKTMDLQNRATPTSSNDSLRTTHIGGGNIINLYSPSDRPREINLSAANFTYSPFRNSTSRSRDVMNTYSSRQPPPYLRSPPRSIDLSPEPRDWANAPPWRSSSPVTSSDSVSRREFSVPSVPEMRARENHKKAITVAEELVVPSSISLPGSDDRSIPNYFPSAKSNTNTSTLYKSNATMNIQSRIDERARSYRGVSGTAARLAAGGSLSSGQQYCQPKCSVNQLTDLDDLNPYQSSRQMDRISDRIKHVDFKSDTTESAAKPIPELPSEQSIDKQPGLVAQTKGSLNSTHFPRSPLIIEAPRPTNIKHGSFNSDIGNHPELQGPTKRSVAVACQVQLNEFDASTTTSSKPTSGANTGVEVHADDANIWCLLRQLFYFIAVGYAVLRISGWIQTISSQSAEGRSYLFGLISAVFKWFFSNK